MHQHICEYCGNLYENNRKISKYCSNECKFKASSKKIECSCDNCGKIIYKKKDEYEKNKNHFCSQKCHYEFKSFGIEKIECLNCGKEIEVFKKDHRKFCCHNCFLEYSITKKRDQIKSDITRKRICKNCNKTFIIYPSNQDKYLCSEKCRVEWLNNNIYNTNEYKEKHINIGRNSFYEKYNSMNTNIILLESYINSRTKIKCLCKIHNETFKMIPSKITCGQTGCKKCMSKSKNEDLISDFLSSFEYKFTRQKIFDGCVDKNKLPFDFYLDDYNTAIEYDGEGHYKPIPRGDMDLDYAIKELENIRRRDKIKTEYCNNNNIKLIRIPYWENDNLIHYLWDKLIENKIIIEEKII